MTQAIRCFLGLVLIGGFVVGAAGCGGDLDLTGDAGNAGAVAGAGDLVIYDDAALQKPWISLSRNGSIDFASSEQVYSGSTAIKVGPRLWGGLSVRSGQWGAGVAVNPALYSRLELAVYGGSAGVSISVQAKNDAGSTFPVVNYGRVAASEWTLISIPMSQLDPTQQPIHIVNINGSAGGSRTTFYVDAMHFVSNRSPDLGTAADLGGNPDLAGQPGCVPTTCAAQVASCGSIDDGCGGSLSCGSCTAPQTCGGGGTANVCGSGSVTAGGKWVTGYHPTWWYGVLKPSMIDFGSLTHLIIFAAHDASTSAPYFDSTGIDDGNDFPQIITMAHAKGVKVLISAVGGYGQTGMPVVAADPVKCQAFVDAAVAFAKLKGADGIELDWEFPRAADKVGWNRLISMFRTALDAWPTRGVLATSMYYSIGGADDGPYQRDAMVAAFDQINPMTYTMWMGAGSGPYSSGFDTPVNLPTQASYVGYSLSAPANGGPLTFLAAGYPASKIGISISFEGTRFDGVTGLGQQYSSWAFTSTVTKPLGSGYAAIPTTGRVWDPVAQANYAVSGGSVYSFQTTSSVAAIASWAKTQGFGGLMLYDIGAGYDDSAGVVPDALLKQAASVTLH